MPIYTETNAASITLSAGAGSIIVGKARPTSVISITVAGGYVAVPTGISGQTVSFTVYGSTASATAGEAFTAAAETSIAAQDLTITYTGF